MEHDAIAVVVGMDVGKARQHAVALDHDGMLLVDRTVANAERQRRPWQDRGPVLLVVGYLPGLTMRRIADTARTRAVVALEAHVADLTMRTGYATDLAHDGTALGEQPVAVAGPSTWPWSPHSGTRPRHRSQRCWRRTRFPRS